MNLCREHGEPSKNQKPGAKNGACLRCKPPERRRPHSVPHKDAEQPRREWWEYLV